MGSGDGNVWHNGIYGLIPATVRVWSDHYSFSSTDMSINFFVFLFLLPHPASKGNASATKGTWRIQYTSIFAFGMNGEPTRGKWGDGELAGSWILPLPQADRTRSNWSRGTELKGGSILNIKRVTCHCAPIFTPSQWRPSLLSLRFWVQSLQLGSGNQASFSYHRQPWGFHRQDLADDFVGDTWRHTDSSTAPPELHELCETDTSRGLCSPALSEWARRKDSGNAGFR